MILDAFSRLVRRRPCVRHLFCRRQCLLRLRWRSPRFESEILVFEIRNADGAYDLFSTSPDPDPGSDPDHNKHLYVSFTDDVVYCFNGDSWKMQPLTHAPAQALFAHDGNLYGAFADGVYYYDGTDWEPEKITAGVASALASFGGDLYGSFVDATYAWDGAE